MESRDLLPQIFQFTPDIATEYFFGEAVTDQRAAELFQI